MDFVAALLTSGWSGIRQSNMYLDPGYPPFLGIRV